jgi:hypothetical protein
MMIEDLVTFLTTPATAPLLTTSVGTRLYPDTAPQKGGSSGDPLAVSGQGLIVYKQISGVRPNTFDGTFGLQNAVYELDCIAYEKKTAKKIAEQLRQTMHTMAGLVGSTFVLFVTVKNERDLYAPDELEYRTDLDFQIWHREP